MKTITLVHWCEFMGDWQALYVDGVLVYDTIDIDIAEFIEHAKLADGTPFTFHNYVITNPDEVDESTEGDIPDALDGMVLVDYEEYFKKRDQSRCNH